MADITARTTRGESAKTIYEALGRQLSISTIQRRQLELRGKAPRPTTSTDDVPEIIPETSTTEDLNRWIARLEKAAAVAESQGNLAALSSIAAKVAALMNLRHRAQPLPKPDPNENPDYKALAAEGEKRLMALAHDLFHGPQ
jgi:hypothetical protein